MYIQELIKFDGVVCEGSWAENGSNPDLTYNTCDNSITLSSAATNFCGSYTLESDGAGNALCGPFTITVNVCIVEPPNPPVISITNNACDPLVAGSINVDTPCEAGATIEYSADSGLTWSVTTPAYDSVNLVTVRARCVNDAESTCLSAETADATSVPEECCPPVNCISQYGAFTIIKNTP